MEVIGSNGESFRYAREKFTILVTVTDINKLRRKFTLIDGRSDVVHVKNLSREQAG